MKDIKIGLAGFGTVGRGTWELLEKNKKKIEKSSKIKISVVAIADPDKSKFEYGEGYVRFALIENNQRIKQAIRGIREMFKKDGVSIK